MNPNFTALIIIGYLLGSIPFGLLISKLKSIDIRKVGSGNIGATNVSRALGKKWFFVVFFLDALKGIIPVLLAKNYLISDWQIILVAISPIIGHVFPVWLNFKGGKGVATTIGVLMALLGWKFFLIWILVWFLILYIFKIMSFTNLVMAIFLPMFLWIFFLSVPFLIFGAILAFLIFWTHRKNISMMKAGTERKIKF